MTVLLLRLLPLLPLTAFRGFSCITPLLSSPPPFTNNALVWTTLGSVSTTFSAFAVVGPGEGGGFTAQDSYFCATAVRLVQRYPLLVSYMHRHVQRIMTDHSAVPLESFPLMC